MAGLTRAAAVASLLVVLCATARDATAYSVLAHEANVDALWDSGIKPLLERRFPRSSSQDIVDARAYAYGGSVIQDLGYYPFGSHFFSNLLHYVRTGDFIDTLIRDARDADEYAFALGALAHYAADNTGHPVAVNRAVPLMFPELREKFGDEVTYVQSPARHIIVEFSFDVVQAAGGGYAPEAYHQFIGFKVAKPLLERAFREIYGLEMKDVFFDEDLAIGTYRHSISSTVPEITRIAWRDKQKEIEKLTPGVKRDTFVFSYTREQYDQEFGTSYRKPGLFARFLGFLYKLLPKIGPLRPLSFKAPTPQAEALFTQSLRETRDRYRAALEAVRAGKLEFVNMNFDIGRRVAHGQYPLADETYAELLHRLSARHFVNVPEALRSNLKAYYAVPAPRTPANRKELKRSETIRKDLAGMENGIGKVLDPS